MSFNDVDGWRHRVEVEKAPRRAVSMVVNAERDGMIPVGVDPATNRIFCVHARSKRTLFATSDLALRSWSSLTQFSAASGTEIRRLWVTSTGAILMVITTTTENKLIRSADNGATWTDVLVGNTVFALPRCVTETPNGDVFFGEYTTLSGTYTLHLWRSVNDGVNWTAVQTWPDSGASSVYAQRHIHGVWSDPFVTNRLWIAIGDTNNQARVGYSDDRGVTFTIIGSGDQSWRVVDMMFTATAVIMGDDSPVEGGYVRSWDRATGVRTAISDATNGAFYYAVKDSDGRFLFTQAAENGMLNATTWTGHVDGSGATTQVATVKTLLVRTDMMAYGPTNDGRIFVCAHHTTQEQSVAKLQRVNLADADLGTEGVTLRDQRFVPYPAVIQAGGSAVAGRDIASIVAGLMYFIKVRPDVDFMANSIQYGVGSVTAGNVMVGFCGIAANGGPSTVLAQSAVTAMGPVETVQNVVLTARMFLTAGTDYWAFLLLSDSTTKVRGTDSRMGVSALARYLTGQTLPPGPGPFDTAITTSARPSLAISS